MTGRLDWTRAKTVPTLTREADAKREGAADAEVADFHAMLAAKRPGMRALVAAKNVPGSTVVLYGAAGCWKRGLCCRGEGHRARAEAYAAAFNGREAAVKPEKPAAVTAAPAKTRGRSKAAKAQSGDVTYPAARVVIETGRTDVPWD